MAMFQKPQSIQAIYLYLILGNTLAASFIWGINTIFLLDAGLNNFQAFAANAFFTAGQVLFEVPTGIVADIWGRRTSYLLGCVTLIASTLLYYYMWRIHGPFWGWAASSMLLGLGFTFFSGALEAWLVDALHATNFQGNLEQVFSKGQMVGGAAMLTGSITGGIIAQYTNLGVPYILRSAVLLINLATAFFLMRDLGFQPKKTQQPFKEVKNTFITSYEQGLKKPAVRWVMLAAPFAAGVSFYIFYALQPFLLKLWGDETAYWIAGLVAALVATSQIVGGMVASRIRKLFSRRTSALILGSILTSILLVLVSFSHNFYAVTGIVFFWGLLFAALQPIRQAYLNAIIPSEQRATVLSFDSLMGSSGAIVIQPVLGKVADVWSYSWSYAIGGAIQLLSVPFLLLARKQKTPEDNMKDTNGNQS